MKKNTGNNENIIPICELFYFDLTTVNFIFKHVKSRYFADRQILNIGKRERTNMAALC